MGWVLRNVGDREAAYAEILRVLKPGGKFLCVDMSQSSFAPLRWAATLYMKLLMPLLVRFIGGDKEAYEYLDKSTRRFPMRRDLEKEWRQAGFVNVKSRALMMGTIAAHLGQRPL